MFHWCGCALQGGLGECKWNICSQLSKAHCTGMVGVGKWCEGIKPDDWNPGEILARVSLDMT